MPTSVPQPMLTQTRERWITSVASYPVIAAPPNLRAIIVGRTWAGHIKNLDNTVDATSVASNGNNTVVALLDVAPAVLRRTR